MSIMQFLGFHDRVEAVSGELAAELEIQLDGFQIEPEPDLLNRSASAIDGVLAHAKVTKERAEATIAKNTEVLRQANIVIASFEAARDGLVDGYDPADDARKSYDVAVETKQKRGDRHWPKRASDKAVLAVAG